MTPITQDEEIISRLVEVETSMKWVNKALEQQLIINKELANKNSAIWGWIAGFVGVAIGLISMVVMLMRGH